MRERDAAPARAVVCDTGIGGELLSRPEDEHDAVRLEEGGALDLERRRLPKRRIKGVRPLVIGHAECDQRHALLHRRTSSARIALPTENVSRSNCAKPSSEMEKNWTRASDMAGPPSVVGVQLSRVVRRAEVDRGIRVIGERWSRASFQGRSDLSRCS